MPVWIVSYRLSGEPMTDYAVRDFEILGVFTNGEDARHARNAMIDKMREYGERAEFTTQIRTLNSANIL